MESTAAALIVGDELLSGKIQDENLAYLSKELFQLGISLNRAVFCPDDIDTIASDVRELSSNHTYVFTSGGVGPTPDDVTLEAVAKAFDSKLETSPEILAMIEAYWGDRATAGHRRMALVPAGANLLRNDEVPWPVIHLGNVYVLPGVPAIFRRNFLMLRDRLGVAVPFLTRVLYTRCDEGTIAPMLASLVMAHPEVRIGSYPRFRDPEYKVKLTFDGRDEATVMACLEACAAQLPPEQIVRRG